MKKGIHAGISLLIGVSIGTIATKALQEKGKKRNDDILKKMREFYELLVRWLSIRQENKSLISYFIQNGYKTVAIYGMKELGERLYDELENSEIKVQYVIDKNAETIYAPVDIFLPADDLPSVDVIVVTAVHYFDEIRSMLEEKVKCPIVSIEDVIYEL